MSKRPSKRSTPVSASNPPVADKAKAKSSSFSPLLLLVLTAGAISGSFVMMQQNILGDSPTASVATQTAPAQTQSGSNFAEIPQPRPACNGQYPCKFAGYTVTGHVPRAEWPNKKNAAGAHISSLTSQSR